MARFSKKAMQRIRKSVKYTERQIRNRPQRRGRWQGGGSTQQTVAFVLAEDLGGFDGATIAEAYRRNWSAAANSGDGGYVTDYGDIIRVTDARGVGYWGCEGAVGACEMRYGDNGAIGVIVDLECPPDSGECPAGSGS